MWSLISLLPKYSPFYPHATGAALYPALLEVLAFKSNDPRLKLSVTQYHEIEELLIVTCLVSSLSLYLVSS